MTCVHRISSVEEAQVLAGVCLLLSFCEQAQEKNKLSSGVSLGAQIMLNLAPCLLCSMVNGQLIRASLPTQRPKILMT